MTTRIYGASDDLIEVDGDVIGETGFYGDEDGNESALLICNDGTLLEMTYGKADMFIWKITIVKKGTLFDRIEPCTDEYAHPHSDQVFFKDGLEWVYAATTWERMR